MATTTSAMHSTAARGAAIVQRDMAGLFPVIDLRNGPLPEPVTIPKAPFCIWVDDTRAALEKLAAFWCAKLNPTVVAIAGCTPNWIVDDLVASILGQRWPQVHRFDRPGDIVSLCFDLLQLKKEQECIILEIHPHELPQMQQMIDLTRPQIGLVIRPPYLPVSADPCPPAPCRHGDVRSVCRPTTRPDRRRDPQLRQSRRTPPGKADEDPPMFSMG